ncbi:MAG: glucosaminidase domain-containing protein [Treponema sp.]|nr:glucosaminidase domain-containing protein [Spirochaetia bacterium]MDD7274231.1 glucosaminidase domain-containing protein [Treponema sp.]MDY4673841.1 glucosaminidase domain-containing protein [Treponema sp.]
MKLLKFSMLPLLGVCLLFFSCTTTKAPKEVSSSGMKVSPVIADSGVKSATQLVDFFMSRNPQGNRDQVVRLANYYVEEAAEEGINSDVAFVQMCLETGFLRFGGLVTPEMNNFCGLGAIDETKRGEWFPTEQIGVRAHIQHLHAYGTTGQLKGELVDNRYKYVNPRGKSPDVFGLAGTWAADKAYGQKLWTLLTALDKF